MILKELLNNTAFIALLGTVIGSLMTWFIQYTQKKFEYQKILLQQKYQENEKWKERFINVSSNLLTILSPTYDKSTKNEVLNLVHQTEILLNLSIESHKKVLNLILPLAFEINGETNKYTDTDLLRLHAELTNAIRNIVALRNN